MNYHIHKRAFQSPICSVIHHKFPSWVWTSSVLYGKISIYSSFIHCCRSFKRTEKNTLYLKHLCSLKKWWLFQGNSAFKCRDQVCSERKTTKCQVGWVGWPQLTDMGMSFWVLFTSHSSPVTRHECAPQSKIGIGITSEVTFLSNAEDSPGLQLEVWKAW